MWNLRMSWYYDRHIFLCPCVFGLGAKHKPSAWWLNFTCSTKQKKVNLHAVHFDVYPHHILLVLPVDNDGNGNSMRSATLLFSFSVEVVVVTEWTDNESISIISVFFRPFVHFSYYHETPRQPYFLLIRSPKLAIFITATRQRSCSLYGATEEV